MRDSDFALDEGADADVRPGDPAEQRVYCQRLRARYHAQTRRLTDEQLAELVSQGLPQCLRLGIRRPLDVMRFLALGVMLTAAQQKSNLLQSVARRVLESTGDWSATKRLDFIYKHVVGHPAPVPEPDFGPWYGEETNDGAWLNTQRF
jgi:hypothetical protein